MVSIMSTGSLLDEAAEKLDNPRRIDSGDPEQIITVAVQRGFPIGAVRGLDQWHRAHNRVKRSRAQYLRRAVDPPPFLDKRIAEEVGDRPLVRRLYSDKDVAALVVEATVLYYVSRSGHDVVGETDLKSPIRARTRGMETEFLASPLKVQNGLVRDNGDEVILGTGPNSMFDSLAVAVSVQEGISSTFDLILARAQQDRDRSDSGLLDAMARFVDDYRAMNEKDVSQLPLENPSEDVEREREIRRSLDDACESVRREIVSRPKRPLPEPFL